MDFSILHPKLVHFPIALAVLMPLVSAGILFSVWRGWLDRRAWWIAALLQVILVGTSIAALQTGEIDAELVEQVVPERFVETHEEAADLFSWAAAVVLVPFLLAVWIRKASPSRVMATVAVAGTVLVLALGYRVGDAGGQLVYAHGAASAHVTQTSTPAPAAAQPRRLDHDDD